MAVQDPGNRLPALDWQTRERFVELARAFERQTGLDLRVRSGLRSCADQRQLYGIGRTYNLGSPPVTYADGCRSWHVTGRAIDADPIDKSGNSAAACHVYTQAGELWERLGGKWGGRFKGFGPCGDAGHFEWHPGLAIEDVCPSPAACETTVRAIATTAPSSWWQWGLGVVVVGLGAMAGTRLMRSA